jgi:hypothetical protein
MNPRVHPRFHPDAMGFVLLLHMAGAKELVGRVEAARQGLSGKAPSFSSLPPSPPRLSNLPDIPEAVRENLRFLDGRHSAALRRRPIHSPRKDHCSRSSIYCRDSRAGRSRRGGRFESSLRQALREQNSRLGPYKGLSRSFYECTTF